MVITVTYSSCITNAYFPAKHASITTKRTIKQAMVISISSTQLQQESGSAKLCEPEGGAQPSKPAGGQDLMC